MHKLDSNCPNSSVFRIVIIAYLVLLVFSLPVAYCVFCHAGTKTWYKNSINTNIYIFIYYKYIHIKYITIFYINIYLHINK